MQYPVLYAKMVDTAKRAIDAIDKHNYGSTREILIAVQRECEESYLQADENGDSAKIQ